MEITLSRGQLEAYKALCELDFVFLTGQAGTGKSTLLKHFIKEMEKQDKSLLKTAPTGIAALVLGGSTLHRTFGIPIPITQRPTKDIYISDRLRELLDATNILIIDEVSMCRLDVFEYVMYIINKYNTYNPDKYIKIVLCGDFLQLPPVLPEKEKEAYELIMGTTEVFAFGSPIWDSIGFKTVTLTEVVRQSEPDLINNLNLARVGDSSCLNYFNSFVQNSNPEAVFLSGKNKDVRALNKVRNDEITANKGYTYKSTVKGEILASDKPCDDLLTLKIGTRVMSVLNEPNGDYSNGSLGTVKRLGYKGVEVAFDNGNICTIQAHEWDINKYVVDIRTDEKGKQKKYLKLITIGSFVQIPLKLAFAITIHKSQGQTYDSVHLDPCCWDYGQLYVALSRCKDPSKLSISREIKKDYLKANPKVIAFLDSSKSSINKGLFKTEVKANDYKPVHIPKAIKKPLNKEASGGRPKKWAGYKTKAIRLPVDFVPLFEKMTNTFVQNETALNADNIEQIIDFINSIK